MVGSFQHLSYGGEVMAASGAYTRLFRFHSFWRFVSMLVLMVSGRGADDI
jgi:hypothetical protein